MILKHGIAGSRFGFTIVNAGDIDRDTFDDIIIGAPAEKPAMDTTTDSGAVYIYFSSANGLSSKTFQVMIWNLETQ